MPLHKHVAFFLLLMLISSDTVIGQNVDYHDIELLGASCAPRDTCERVIELPFNNRSCECDDKCRSFDDCCVDAPRRTSRAFMRPIQGLECLESETDVKGVYVVSRCQSNWRGPAEVRLKCENLNDMTDPLAAAPAVDIANDITYKNRYCAQCNNAPADYLRSWEFSIECKEIPNNSSTPLVNPEYVTDHLTHVTSGNYSNNWGFYYRRDDQRNSEDIRFYPCDIPFHLPDSIQDHVRYCRPNLTSTCPQSYRRQIVRNQCAAYTAVIYINFIAYKNPHCALCNNQNLQNKLCNLPSSLSIDSRKKKPALSFTLLLDVNMSDGNRVGEVRDNRCPSKQKWDPFFKKCRTLVCAVPGYKMQNGRCVKP